MDDNHISPREIQTFITIMSREEANKATTNNFHALGGDINKAHPMEFFLYFPTEWDAYVAASQLMNLQFNTSVNYSDQSDEWLCLASKKVKPNSERLVEMGNFLEKLATGNNGNYDGWGTIVIGESGGD